LDVSFWDRCTSWHRRGMPPGGQKGRWRLWENPLVGKRERAGSGIARRTRAGALGGQLGCGRGGSACAARPPWWGSHHRRWQGAIGASHGPFGTARFCRSRQLEATEEIVPAGRTGQSTRADALGKTKAWPQFGQCAAGSFSCIRSSDGGSNARVGWPLKPVSGPGKSGGPGPAWGWRVPPSPSRSQMYCARVVVPRARGRHAPRSPSGGPRVFHQRSEVGNPSGTCSTLKRCSHRQPFSAAGFFPS